jgi:hypothetical protein
VPAWYLGTSTSGCSSRPRAVPKLGRSVLRSCDWTAGLTKMFSEHRGSGREPADMYLRLNRSPGTPIVRRSQPLLVPHSRSGSWPSEDVLTVLSTPACPAGRIGRVLAQDGISSASYARPCAPSYGFNLHANITLRAQGTATSLEIVNTRGSGVSERVIRSA